MNSAQKGVWLALAIASFAGFGEAANVILNPSFEINPSGAQTGPGGKYWSFRERTNRFRQNDVNNVETLPTLFPPRGTSRTHTGTGLIVLRLKAGAQFPATTRFGQFLNLQNLVQYQVDLYVRVDVGVASGTIVSAFCENRVTKAFVGKDTTILTAPGGGSPGSYVKSQYSKISYNVVGDGNQWVCYVGLLGQPTSQYRELSVDDFSLCEVQTLPPPNPPSTNVITDPVFDGSLAPWNYPPPGRLVLTGNGWQEIYPFGFSPRPEIRPTGTKRLVLRMPGNRGNFDFSGVVQKVSLVAGQKYQLSINYNRENPIDVPQNANATVFNYYVRLPDSTGPSGPVKFTEGTLFGSVDVLLPKDDPPFGTASSTFAAPVQSNDYEVVLKINAYGNEEISGQHRISFDNAKLVPI